MKDWAFLLYPGSKTSKTVQLYDLMWKTAVGPKGFNRYAKPFQATATTPQPGTLKIAIN